MARAPGPEKEVDVLIAGAGILGVTIAYWLSSLYDCRVLLVDREEGAGAHASTRNTGVIHRPFYLNPDTKKAFAKAAGLSYPLWRDLAARDGLPWTPLGTLEVAVRDDDVRHLEEHMKWAERNGIPEGQTELLDGLTVKSMEPEVECAAALHSKTDVSVDFGRFTGRVFQLALGQGVSFVGGLEVSALEPSGGALDVSFKRNRRLAGAKCRLLINAAGGGSLDVAHMAGLAKEYATLNFRGEYWVVDEPFASKVSRNVYVLPRHLQYPFLDPHFVVRWDGLRQIGPNAVMVTGPYVYKGLGIRSLRRLLSSPAGPKLRLLANREFFSLVADEWRSSISKRAMCGRVRAFIPGLDVRHLNARGVAGVRSSLVGPEGFVPEALVVQDDRSVHVLNYNSPGATGAPSYSAGLVARLREGGVLDGLRRKPYRPDGMVWDFAKAAGLS
jgi:L-2-hydroxyglutarate oxidase